MLGTIPVPSARAATAPRVTATRRIENNCMILSPSYCWRDLVMRPVPTQSGPARLTQAAYQRPGAPRGALVHEWGGLAITPSCDHTVTRVTCRVMAARRRSHLPERDHGPGSRRASHRRRLERDQPSNLSAAHFRAPRGVTLRRRPRLSIWWGGIMS